MIATASSIFIAETFSENYRAEIRRDRFGCVSFLGDLDVDADGANGQNGKQAAYMVGEKGSELLANGGMRMHGNRVVGVQSWWKDIVYTGLDGQPFVLPNGVVPSKTAFQFPSPSPEQDQFNQWQRQADSANFAYIVVPPEIVLSRQVPEIVKGCLARVTYKGKFVWAFVGDVGPRNRVGEGSIKLCELLGVNANPRNGGVEKQEVLFELWPGVFGTLNDGISLREKVVPLLSAKGEYRLAA